MSSRVFSLRRAAAWAAIFSVGIECCQLLLVLLINNDRGTDINDVIANTLGRHDRLYDHPVRRSTEAATAPFLPSRFRSGDGVDAPRDECHGSPDGDLVCSPGAGDLRL
ncbi:VanZ family protein [Planotetraspora kaengkrachanensis]